MEGRYKKLRQELMGKVTAIDIKSETTGLNFQERQMKAQCEQQLKDLMREEEIKLRQRAKERDIMEGDQNTKYFQLKVNGRRRRTRI